MAQPLLDAFGFGSGSLGFEEQSCTLTSVFSCGEARKGAGEVAFFGNI